MKKMYDVEYDNKTVHVVTEYEEYDERFCCDGGSYYQPYITCRAGNDALVIEDSSCGDFGTRINVTLWHDHSVMASAYYGTMLVEDAEDSDFAYNNGAQMFWLNFAYDILGYCIPVDYNVNLD